MNKTLAATVLGLSTLSFSFAQSASIDSDTNGIRDDVDSVILQIKSTYSLSPAQVSAANQVARSQGYILTFGSLTNATYRTRQEAVEVAKRDTAATNCASSRLPAILMDIVYSRIESATFNTSQRQAAQDYYTSLLGEDDNITPVVVSACEDSFSTPLTPTPQVNNYLSSQAPSVNAYSSNPGGMVADQDINYPCTVMTTFMEYGSRAPQVLTLQKFLSDTGYMEMWPTGYFGRNTEAAVRLWQTRHGVDVRGYVGPNTRGSIASITCKGDTASVSRAQRGAVAVTKTTNTYVAPRVNTYVQTPVTVVTAPVVETAPVAPVYGTARLSNASGTFYTRRSPVNTLYVTYRSDITTSAGICFEKGTDNNCSNPDNFVALQSQYRPGSYDAIPNSDRWMLNFYYNASQWSNGGRVHLKSSTASAADVYTIRAVDSL